jgi:5-methylcytosine-specific restriction endonuclease McrA
MEAWMSDMKCKADEIVAAVRDCYSIASVLRRLNLRVAGSNYATLKRLIRDWSLDVSHWTGQGHRKGSSIPVVPPRPLEAVLRRDCIVNSNALRRRLIREGLLKPECCGCGLKQWLGRPIPLELDHRDGDRNNQELENLRLLCPNCHALTPNYRGRNRRGRRMAKLL